jgi:hypothetical protein
MRKSVLVVGACAFLGGCALPVPIQVASWALDVISVVATEKSLTDHGISALTNKDCALYRAVTEEDSVICRDADDIRGDVMTADAGNQPARALIHAGGRPGATRFEAVEAEVAKAPVAPEPAAKPVLAVKSHPAAFETAASAGEPTVLVDIDLAALQPLTEEVNRPFVRFSERKAETIVPSRQIASAADPSSAMGRPKAGFYYVIGSFRGGERAKRHMQTYRSLVPAVLHGKIGRDGRDVYRVVVGPFKGDERSVAFRRIKRAGIPDTWAIRVSPNDWSLAARLEPTQQADASAVLNSHDWPGLARFIAER